RGKLFEELVRAAWRERDDAFTGLITDIQKRVAHSHRDVREATRLAAVHVVAELHFVTAFQEVDRLVLMVVDVQGRTAVRLDGQDEYIQRAVGVGTVDLVQQGIAGNRVVQQAVSSG